MFETVVPETAAPRSRRLFYETLPVSVALHALVVASVLAVTLWEIKLPTDPPKLYAAFALVTDPPPPPPPPPPPAQPRTAPKVRPPNLPLMAPTVIPDTIPDVTEPPPVEIATTGIEGGVDRGEPGGEIGGIVGGTAKSVAVEPPPPPPPSPPILEVARDAPLPMGAISQDFPAYPPFALSRGWQDELIVRYLIGKDGRVKDVSVIQPPEREEFTRAALSAIRHWRFHPFRDEKGEAKEVVHELTVQFKIARRKAS